MKIQLSSIDQAPASLPVWQTILADLGDPPARRVAKVLGVSERTVYRWHGLSGAPRIACLALFWLTRWGRSAVDAQATNDARTAVGYALALQSDLERLRLSLLELARSDSTGGNRQRWLFTGLPPNELQELATLARTHPLPPTPAMPAGAPSERQPPYTGWRGGDARHLWNRAPCRACGRWPDGPDAPLGAQAGALPVLPEEGALPSVEADQDPTRLQPPERQIALPTPGGAAVVPDQLVQPGSEP